MNQDLANKGWGAMEKLLDEHLPTERRRRPVPFIWLWFGIASLLLVGVFYYVNRTTVSTPKPADTPAASLTQSQSSLKPKPLNAIVTNEPAPTNQTSEVQDQVTIAETVAADINRGENVSSQTKEKRRKQNNQRSDQNIGSTTSRSNAPEQATVASASAAPAQHTSSLSENRLVPSAATDKMHIDATTNQHVQQSNQETYSAELAGSDRSEKKSKADKISDFSSLAGLPSLALNRIVRSSQLLKLEDLTPKIKLQANDAPDFQWAVGAGVLVSNGMIGGQVDLGRYVTISNRFALYTGVAYNHMTWDKKTGSRSLGQADLVNSKAYTQYLADENIQASDFIRSTSTVYIPIHVQYSLDRFQITGGIKPGVQINQRLSYTPLTAAESDLQRNPNVGSNLSASDFFNKKSIGVISTTIGVGYTFGTRWALFANYDMSLSDVSRGVQYAGPDKLERIGAGEIARPYYEIRQDAIRPKTYELKLQYRF